MSPMDNLSPVWNGRSQHDFRHKDQARPTRRRPRSKISGTSTPWRLLLVFLTVGRRGPPIAPCQAAASPMHVGMPPLDPVALDTHGIHTIGSTNTLPLSIGNIFNRPSGLNVKPTPTPPSMSAHKKSPATWSSPTSSSSNWASPLPPPDPQPKDNVQVASFTFVPLPTDEALTLQYSKKKPLKGETKKGPKDDLWYPNQDDDEANYDDGNYSPKGGKGGGMMKSSPSGKGSKKEKSEKKGPPPSQYLTKSPFSSATPAPGKGMMGHSKKSKKGKGQTLAPSKSYTASPSQLLIPTLSPFVPTVQPNASPGTLAPTTSSPTTAPLRPTSTPVLSPPTFRPTGLPATGQPILPESPGPSILPTRLAIASPLPTATTTSSRPSVTPVAVPVPVVPSAPVPLPTTVSPTSSPSASPVSVTSPTLAPISVVTSAPVSALSNAPTSVPVIAPVPVPAPAPASPNFPPFLFPPPSEAPVQTAAPSPPPLPPSAGIPVPASPFIVTYIPTNGIPLQSDLNTAAMLTCQHIQDFAKTFFEMNPFLQYLQTECSAVSFDTSVSPLTIGFNATTIFGPGSTDPLPIQADIDSVIATALLPPSVNQLTSELQALESTNPFSAVTDVTSSVIASSRDSTVGPGTGQGKTSFLMIMMAGSFSLILTGLLVKRRRRRRKENFPKYFFVTSSPPPPTCEWDEKKSLFTESFAEMDTMEFTSEFDHDESLFQRPFLSLDS